LRCAGQEAANKGEREPRGTGLARRDMRTWREAARAHDECFGSIRPVCRFGQVSRFSDPQWFVEVDANAIVA